MVLLSEKQKTLTQHLDKTKSVASKHGVWTNGGLVSATSSSRVGACSAKPKKSNCCRVQKWCSRTQPVEASKHKQPTKQQHCKWGKTSVKRLSKHSNFQLVVSTPLKTYQWVKTGIFPNFRDDSIKHIWVAITQIWLKRQHCDIKNPLVTPLRLEKIFEQFEDVPAGLLF